MNYHLKDGLSSGIHSSCRRTDEQSSADIIHVIWHISHHCASHTM